MSVGLAVTKAEIDARAGDLARNVQRLAGDAVTLKGYLDGTTEQALVDLGYSTNEVAVLNSAITDLHQLLVQIGSGVEALAAPKDFTTFLRQLWGVGAF
jgi:hypothetical protein